MSSENRIIGLFVSNGGTEPSSSLFVWDWCCTHMSRKIHNQMDFGTLLEIPAWFYLLFWRISRFGIVQTPHLIHKKSHFFRAHLGQPINVYKTMNFSSSLPAEEKVCLWVGCALKRNMIIKYSPFVPSTPYSALHRTAQCMKAKCDYQIFSPFVLVLFLPWQLYSIFEHHTVADW